MTQPMIPFGEVGSRITFWEPAGTCYVPGKGESPQKFAHGAFGRSIGKIIPLKIEGRTWGHGRVVSAEVAEDGSGVSITCEVVDRVMSGAQTPPGEGCER